MATKITTPILDTTWIQVTDSAFFMNDEGQRQLRMTWKAATTKLAPMTAQLEEGQSLDVVNTIIATTFTNVDDGGFSPNWTLPTGYIWIVNSVEVKQIEAGEYSILVVTFTTIEQEVSPGQGFVKQLEDSWQLQWQTYSVSPYRYCNNRDHIDYLLADDGTIDPSAASQGHDCTIRQHIEKAITQNAQNSDQRVTDWSDENSTYRLTESERAILAKVSAGVNPVFHYPVVVHVRSIQTDLSAIPDGYGPDVDNGIDVIASLPQSSSRSLGRALQPWTDMNGQFIYCGQSVQSQTQTIKVALDKDTTIYTYTFQDLFEGALSADTNFYGDPDGVGPQDPAGRWKFGEGPLLPSERET